MNKCRRFILSVCFIDINNLKKVNDTYGHEHGDALIVDVVQNIQLNIRTDDFIVRFGGDEFLIVFNGIDSDLSEKIWQRIVQQFIQINSTNDRPYKISVSHGIMEFNQNSILTVDELISEADKKCIKRKQG